MAVVASATGAAVFGLSGVAAGVAGGALLGAGAGALYSGLTGDGNILNSALTGGLLGASVGGLGAAAAGTTAGGTALGAAPSTLAAPTANVLTQVPAAGLTSPAALDALAASKGVFAEGATSLPGTGLTAAPEVITPQLMAATGAQSAPVSSTALTGKEMLGYGLAGTAALSLLGSQNQPKIQTPPSTSYIRPYTYSQTRNPLWGQPGQPYYVQKMTAQPTYQAAEGGLMSSGVVERMSEANAGKGTYPGAFLDYSTYSTPSQMPTSAEIMRSDYEVNTDPYNGTPKRMAEGGDASIPTSQAVQDYNKLLSSRAAEEYLNNPMLAAFRPASTQPKVVAPPVETPQTYAPGAAGLYEYYLGRKPAENELAQWNIDPNAMATPESAAYFNQYTAGELGRSGYKPKGPDPFLNPQVAPQGTPFTGLPTYSYNPVTRSYTTTPSMQAPMSSAPPPMANNMDMGGGGSGGDYAGGGLMPNSLRFDRGGKAEKQDMFEGLSEKDKKTILLDMMVQSFKSKPGQEYTGMMNVPQGAFGRVGASKELDDNSRLQAGLSGIAMAVPGQHGVKTMPGNIDVGYTTARNSDYDPYLDLSAYRSINPMTGRGHAQGVNAKYTVPFMAGGQAGYNLGGYSDGGRLLKGPGDGMSDNIPASIGNRQPARLADGEFVIPADVVSHLGNGSTDAGAKKLYAMMDKVRNARTGNKSQGKQIKADKYLKT